MVAAADVPAEAARETARELEGAIDVELDVASRKSVDAGPQAAAQVFGRLDVVVSKADVTVIGAPRRRA